MSDPTMSVLVTLLPFVVFFIALMCGAFGKLENRGALRHPWAWVSAFSALGGITIFLGCVLLFNEPAESTRPAEQIAPPAKVEPAMPRVIPG